MLIKYVIPEDDDDLSHPNVFSIGNVQSPTLGMIKKLFPIPGKYHYRYLKTLNNMTVWMDVVDDAAVVQAFDGKIFLKASRISEDVQLSSSDFPLAPVQRQAEQQQQQQRTPSKTNTRSTIPKPPSSSETLLAFGSDDINDDNLIGGGSFMDINNNDLIGLGTDSTVNLTKSSSNLDMFGIDSLQPTLLSALQGQGSIPVGSSYSSPPLTNLSGQQQHQQQQHDTISRGMSGMTGNTSVGLPLRGHSPHPVDAFSGLGSQNTRQPPQQTQTRRPY